VTASASGFVDPPVPAWQRRWRDLRNRLLANGTFQDLAARFPPTRFVARREARALFDLCAGFVYSQTLAACVELDLFAQLAAGAETVEHLAARGRLAPAALLRLARAGAALRLLETDGARVALGPLGAALLANPGIAAMVRHHALLYRDLADPVGLLRGETNATLAGFWPYEGGDAPRADAYSQLMAASQPMIAAGILATWKFRRHRRILDVGGGDGRFLEAVAARAPALALMLFDLPDVAALARARFAGAGLAGRAAAWGGDMRADRLPEGADSATLVRVLHDHDDDDAMAILRNVRACLQPGATLLIAEPLAAAAGAAPVGDAYFGFYLLAMGRGRPRRAAELAAMAERAGFIGARQIATPQPLLTGLIAARAG
jgi:demethylspheroidene O-methyltransferase